MTIEHPIEDEVTQLARRVEKARGRLAYQFDPALTEALSEDELHAERELAERIRGQDRGQRWKQAQAAAAAADRARQTTDEIEKADMRDLLLARTAIAAQRRESSPHAKLASLYRHRSWSLRALAGVVGAGMLWSAVNVQHNIAPGGPTDPLYWFSYLLEAMISVCLIIIMIGTNKVAEWGVVDNRRQVVVAEICLLSLTVTLNTYPYLRAGHWYDAAVHAVAPVMIGVALLIHDAASARYGLAIARATEQVRELPDPAEQIRRTLPPIARYRLSLPAGMATSDPVPYQSSDVEPDQLEAGAEHSQAPIAHADDESAAATEAIAVADTDVLVRPDDLAAALMAPVRAEKRRAPRDSDRGPTAPAENGHALDAVESRLVAPAPAEDSASAARATSRPAAPESAEKHDAPTIADSESGTPVPTSAATAKTDYRPATRPSAPDPVPPTEAVRPITPTKTWKTDADSRTAASAGLQSASAPDAAKTRKTTAPAAKNGSVPTDVENGKEVAIAPPEPDQTYLQAVRSPDVHDTGQFRVADILEQELAELQAERRRARTSRQRSTPR